MIQLYALLVLVLLFFSMSGDVTGCFLFPCTDILARVIGGQKGQLHRREGFGQKPFYYSLLITQDG